MSYVPPPVSNATHEPIPNHLAWAIIATVFSLCLCCGVPGLITGIIAIVYSTHVNSKLNAGDIEGARRASKNAKTYCWITTAFAVIGLLWLGYNLTIGDGMAQYQEMMETIQATQ